jgi:hypothetical protein
MANGKSQIGKSANQQIGKSANRQIGKSANQQMANRRYATGDMR